MTPLKRKAGLKRTGFKQNKNKYNAVRCADSDGNQFDSKNEMARYKFLQMLQKGGQISQLVLHPKITLIEARGSAKRIAWTVDYSYEEDGRTVYEDSKPRPMDGREILLCKLWKHFGPGLLIITGSSRDNFRTLKRFMPEPATQLDLGLD